MKILALLNRDGGSLKTTNLEQLAALLHDEFQVHGHELTVESCSGEEIVASITKAAARDDLDVLLVGGGDGTVSAAAEALTDGRIALGILPAGTMNLFARTLQIPLALEQAVAALASGEITAVDIAAVNGKPFVHQYAVGLHARMVRMRKRITYASRIGKLIATSRAVFMALRRFPVVDLELEIDGVVQRITTPAVAISNNLYGDGHIPYADDPKGGELGIYICVDRDLRSVLKVAVDIMLGGWRQNSSLKVTTAQEVRIFYEGRHHHKRAVRDGELVDIEPEMTVTLRPLGLSVLVPSDATYLR
ncbi:diacylglycerol kinase family protein [Aurantimonas sp. A2-1-M11]|uniref:diacylglycerol/lipid kinase family protein n=1 Tax=Aurantimonas sp. A2-1-M11 TaxID=3113712 RepID=UPI002F931511